MAKDVQGENCLFLTRVYVCAQLLGYFNFGGLLNHKSSLFTLDIISLSDIWFKHFSSYFVVYIFALLMTSFAVAESF